eukprot:724427_1
MLAVSSSSHIHHVAFFKTYGPRYATQLQFVRAAFSSKYHMTNNYPSQAILSRLYITSASIPMGSDMSCCLYPLKYSDAVSTINFCCILRAPFGAQFDGVVGVNAPDYHLASNYMAALISPSNKANML